MAREFWRGDPRERAGLTRRDWIAVVLLLGLAWVVIMVMMFPALNGRVNELHQCANNLSSLGKAIGVYRTISGGAWPVVSTEPVDSLPGNAHAIDARSRSKVAGYSWIVGLLPNLGENNMYTQIRTKSDRFSRAAFDPALVDDEGKHFSQTTVKVLQCPVSGTTGSQAPEYREMTQKLGDENARQLPVATTSFVAISATHLGLVLPDDGPAKPNGVIAYSPDGKGVSKIGDGETNTLVLCETREPNYAVWFDGTTAWVVAHDPNSKAPVQDPTKGCWECHEDQGCRSSLVASMEAIDEEDEGAYYRRNWAGREPWRYGPSGAHSGGLVNHMFADARVQAIRAVGPTRIDASVYLALVTRDGGEQDKPPD